MSVVAIAIIVAGAVVAVLGAVATTLLSRRSVGETGQRIGSDIAVAVGVTGLVGMVFGAGYLGYLLLIPS